MDHPSKRFPVMFLLLLAAVIVYVWRVGSTAKVPKILSAALTAVVSGAMSGTSCETFPSKKRVECGPDAETFFVVQGKTYAPGSSPLLVRAVVRGAFDPRYLPGFPNHRALTRPMLEVLQIGIDSLRVNDPPAAKRVAAGNPDDLKRFMLIYYSKLFMDERFRELFMSPGDYGQRRYQILTQDDSDLHRLVRALGRAETRFDWRSLRPADSYEVRERVEATLGAYDSLARAEGKSHAKERAAR